MATANVITILRCLLNRGVSSEDKTQYFSGVSHDALVNALMDYLNNNRHFLGYCHLEKCHAMNEKGVDLILETDDCKVGFQIKSHFDVTEKDFAAKVKKQFAESFSHGLDHYFILICSSLISDRKPDNLTKLTHLLNDLSLYKNVSFDAYGPVNTIGVFKDPPKVSRKELLLSRAITDECLHEYEKGYEHLPELDNDELNALGEVVDSFGKNLWESEEGIKAFDDYQELVWKKAAEQFETTFLPTLPPHIVQQRKELIGRSKFLLAESRKCRSWDDKSELKLWNWIEHVPETMIPYTSLPNLLRIADSLEEYLEIHRQMD